MWSSSGRLVGGRLVGECGQRKWSANVVRSGGAAPYAWRKWSQRYDGGSGDDGQRVHGALIISLMDARWPCGTAWDQTQIRICMRDHSGARAELATALDPVRIQLAANSMKTEK